MDWDLVSRIMRLVVRRSGAIFSGFTMVEKVELAGAEFFLDFFNYAGQLKFCATDPVSSSIPQTYER